MRLYLTWAALMAFLVATFASSYVPLGGWNSTLNMAISVAKGLLIAFFFMELTSAGKLLRLAAITGLLWLCLLFGLSWTDLGLRPHQGAPWVATGAAR